MSVLVLSAALPAAAGSALHEGLPPGITTPCATPSTWADVVDPEPLPSDGLPGIDKTHRDAYGAPHALVSEHFALRYGDDGDVSEAQLLRLLDAFEAAWAVQIDELQHEAPFGTESTYFNVYVGDTDPRLPPGRTAAGYYTTDRQGWPMIVIAARTLANPDYADITAAHEFYHAVQGATGRYTYGSDSVGAWFWESSAVWASAEVYPENPGYTTFLPAYAYLPHRRVDFFDYPDEGVLQEYYQYGSFVLLMHLAERTGSGQVVRDAWMDAGSDPSPIEVMRSSLSAQGYDFDALWMDHIARNATWDYPQGELYKAQIDAWAGRFPGEDRQIAAWLDRNGTAEGWSPPESLQPERYGANVLAMERPAGGTYTFEVQGDEVGRLGNPARYGATLVLAPRFGTPEYRPLDFEGNDGSIVVDDIAGVDRVYLVVGAWTPERVQMHQDERFSYTVFVDHEPIEVEEEIPLDPPGEDATAGCGCASTSVSGPAAAWLLGVGALIGLRRRR